MDDAFGVRGPPLGVAIVRCGGCDDDDGPFGDEDNDDRAVALITQLSDKFFFTLLY